MEKLSEIEIKKHFPEEDSLLRIWLLSNVNCSYETLLNCQIAMQAWIDDLERNALKGSIPNEVVKRNRSNNAKFLLELKTLCEKLVEATITSLKLGDDQGASKIMSAFRLDIESIKL